MASRYANATTYRDSGTWAARYLLDGKAQATFAINFTTAFDRNNGMRLVANIKVAETGAAYVYKVSTKNFKKFEWDWNRWPGGFRGSTAYNAFEAPIAETEGPVAFVPALLMPEQDFKHIRLTPGSLTGVADAGDESIDGVACFVIDANGWCGQQIRLWIDESGGLRKLWGLYQSSTGVLEKPMNALVETTVVYDPEFDPEVRIEELAVVPSEGSSGR